MNRIRMSETLVIVEIEGAKAVCCRDCEQRLCTLGKEPWKQGAKLNEYPMEGVGGDTYTTGPGVVLRQFVCPACGSLLDVETALAGDPFLNDVLYV